MIEPDEVHGHPGRALQLADESVLRRDGHPWIVGQDRDVEVAVRPSASAGMRAEQDRQSQGRTRSEDAAQALEQGIVRHVREVSARVEIPASACGRGP